MRPADTVGRTFSDTGSPARAFTDAIGTGTPTA
jgi:hypothetical protein